ncbi:hypothetical protein MRX96_016287 [Rhipicephalus microplus]
MLLLLDDDHKQHIQFITTVDEPVAKEFCKIANEFLVRGVNTKVYHSAAQKLQVDHEVVQGCRRGPFPPSQPGRKAKAHRTTLSGIAAAAQLFRVRVRGTGQWRLEAEIATRCLKSHVTPLVTFKFHLKQGDGGETREVVLQTDPLNLLHITESLEEALQSAKSLHMRRIAKHVK